MGAVVRYNSGEEKMLARLMRAEAEGEGTLGMLMVGNTGVNRILGDCMDFKRIRTVSQMVYQSPGGFEAVQRPYFYKKARDKDIRLARRALRGERHHPASHSLWYFRPARQCPAKWYGQWNSGKFKSHCFYIPIRANCPQVY